MESILRSWNLDLCKKKLARVALDHIHVLNLRLYLHLTFLSVSWLVHGDDWMEPIHSKHCKKGKKEKALTCNYANVVLVQYRINYTLPA